MIKKKTRIRHKLYVSAIFLTVLIASVGTSMVVWGAVSNVINISNLKECVSNFREDLFYKETGSSWGKLIEQGAIPNKQMQRMLELESKPWNKRSMSAKCGVSQYEEVGDSQSIIYQSTIFIFALWLMPLLLFAWRKWFRWLVREDN